MAQEAAESLGGGGWKGRIIEDDDDDDDACVCVRTEGARDADTGICRHTLGCLCCVRKCVWGWVYGYA